MLRPFIVSVRIRLLSPNAIGYHHRYKESLFISMDTTEVIMSNIKVR